MKSDISLLEVASTFGYRIHKKKTSANSISMRSTSDTVIIKKSTDNKWIYCNVNDETDNGTIIDFIMQRMPGLSFSEAVQKISEKYLGKILDAPKELKKLNVKTVLLDKESVLRLFNQLTVSTHNQYLTTRGVKKEILIGKRFSGCVYSDSYNNVVFPHYDENGVTGFEQRNTNFRGFTKGGKKCLWMSNCFSDDNRLFLVEGAIDALSHYQYGSSEITRYISIGGQPSRMAWAMIANIIEAFSKTGGEIISGFDNDRAGHMLTEKLRKFTPIRINRETADKKDWNEMINST